MLDAIHEAFALFEIDPVYLQIQRKHFIPAQADALDCLTEPIRLRYFIARTHEVIRSEAYSRAAYALRVGLIGRIEITRPLGGFREDKIGKRIERAEVRDFDPMANIVYGRDSDNGRHNTNKATELTP